jgi:hypothetical protein
MEPEPNQSLFPLHIQSSIESHNGQLLRDVTLNSPFSVVLGPNGSGKTHLLRGMKTALYSAAAGKKIRFLSAGRMGLFEQFRSDYDGHRGSNPRYDEATYGSKDDSKRRHQIETLQGDFQTLSQRVDIQIKVQERIRKLFRRDLIIEWDAGNLKVLFNRSDGTSAPYSSGREASGLMHLVGLLSALYDDEVGVLMIDEPEVSLHPQLQAFLLQELLDVAGQPSDGTNKKIIVIATHSTEMVRLRTVDDLPNLIFCNDLREDPVQVQPDAPELQNKNIINLVASLGQLHRLSLFSTRPLLVEGASDSIICQALARRLKLFPEAAGSQLLPVEGKGNLAIVAKLLRLMGKSPTVLADLDGFADGPTLIQDYLSAIPEVSSAEAAVLGASSGSDLAKGIHDKVCEVTAKKWSIIEPFAVTHPYWLIGTKDENLRRRRAFLGTLFYKSDAELGQLESGAEFVNLKTRVSALFDLAEKCGLFFCRKGTIESNYFGEIVATDFDKPQAATDEASTIAETAEDTVTSRYSDVVRCITFASNVEKICEAEALQDLLLSVAAPAQGRLVADSSDGDLNALARQTIGERAGLFQVAKKNGNLEIDVSSRILDVADCFPITIRKDENVVSAIGKALKLVS